MTTPAELDQAYADWKKLAQDPSSDPITTALAKVSYRQLASRMAWRAVAGLRLEAEELSIEADAAWNEAIVLIRAQ